MFRSQPDLSLVAGAGVWKEAPAVLCSCHAVRRRGCGRAWFRIDARSDGGWCRRVFATGRRHRRAAAPV